MDLPEIPVEISDHYEHDYDESQRINQGLGELELIRTREIVERYLPAGRLRVLDVGGGTGVHARWLARGGHVVELVDPMPRHIAAAQALASEGLPVTARDRRRQGADPGRQQRRCRAPLRTALSPHRT